ncbi:response regulator transcription factor [Flavobacterium sp. JP2137]|uniref:response regulator transcription factor n=1 Tax=Flavobacterium sp. JP2137 TaxID=3414510 RepID=UPI003D2FF614
MKILFFFFHFALVSQLSHATNIKEQAQQYAVQLKFDKSILLLHPIIASSHSSDLEKYEAYYEKYQIYKLLYNYSEAVYNLDLARKYGIKTALKNQLIIRHELELLLVACEKTDYVLIAESADKIHAIKKKPLQERDFAILIFLEAIVLMEQKQTDLERAQTLLDQSIDLLKIHEPQYLPIVFRTKIRLHILLDQGQKVWESYLQGIQYAKQFNRVTYSIDLHRSMSDYQKSIGNFKKSIELSKVILESVTLYNPTRIGSELKYLENDLKEKHSKLVLETRRQKTYVIILIVVSLASIIVILIMVLRKRRKKIACIEQQNVDLRLNLENLFNAETSDDQTNKENSYSYTLTNRQKEIIELVKKNKSNKQIAKELFISENTVKYHLKIIYELLNVHKRTDL